MALLIYAGPQVEVIHDSLPLPTKPADVTSTQWTDYRNYTSSFSILTSFSALTRVSLLGPFGLPKIKREIEFVFLSILNVEDKKRRHVVVYMQLD